MITVYSTKNCAYCPTVKKYLTLKKVEFIEVDVTDDHEMRHTLQQKTGYSTVPVTTDGETFVVGWKPAQLAKLISK